MASAPFAALVRTTGKARRQIPIYMELHLYQSKWGVDFRREVARVIKNKKVLDVGCGHGEFTTQYAQYAKEIVGFDVTENFIKVGTEHSRKNVSFVVGNSKYGGNSFPRSSPGWSPRMLSVDLH
jgi:2-polyprenyl-3-methyl-5-hydroxy-6-metoxy-1,4-benzoquinol methylase